MVYNQKYPSPDSSTPQIDTGEMLLPSDLQTGADDGTVGGPEAVIAAIKRSRVVTDELRPKGLPKAPDHSIIDSGYGDHNPDRIQVRLRPRATE